MSGTGRLGTPDAAFLLGPDVGFVTGTGLLIDAGVVAVVAALCWAS